MLLAKLECHFTWGLNDANVNYLQYRLKSNIEMSVREDRNIGWSYNNLAFTKFMQGLLEEARDDLEKAEEHIRKHHGDNCERQLIVTYGNFAWVYYHMGEHAQSQTYLDKLEKIKMQFPTESPAVLHPEIYGEKGRAFMSFSQQYYEKAKECFEKALELEPEEIEWNESYAVALCRTEFNHTSFEESPASRQLRRVLELDPNNAYMMVLLGLKHASYKQNRRAEELMERAMDLDPNKPYVIQYVAKFYRKNKQFDKALSFLKRLQEMTPNSAFLHHQLALIYMSKRQMSIQDGGEEAEALLTLCFQHLNQAISIQPSFVYAKLDLADCYIEKNNFKKAEEMFQETFKVATAKNDHPHVVEVRYADFQLYHMKSVPLAIMHYKEGLRLQKDTPEGKRCAQQLKKLLRNPHDGEAYGLLGYVHEITGEKLQAIECYEKALLLDPGNEEYLTALRNLR
ncbi:interferon-induced protein with tetratricopeptide repeats 5-like [Conger conger]|uniref:interferon-induced protein with tetratricopeptide repeats 5-like n=1 Tax=Conger conger TaxID=82655 RepID=UPI002A59B938|nr:interferon-induced protein with tetratricopeptide repeats 5-like [Conger conger]